ncbi:MAG TPA: Gfo/Idh/MocA family oxidoreductase [Ktedonobacterales bacterium]
MASTLLLTDETAYERAKRLQRLLSLALPEHELVVAAADSAAWRRRLTDVALVVADTDAPLSESQAAALLDFIRAGGGLLAIGATVEAWRASALGAAVGLPAGRRGPATELLVRPAGDHDITRRLDESFPVYARPFLPNEAQADVTPLLLTSWRYTTVPLVWLRREGAGMLIVSTLDAEDAMLEAAPLWQALFRSARYLTGWREPAAIRIAMIGYGAIGYEHASAISETPGLDLALACDRNTARLDAARERFPSLRVVGEVEEVFAADDVDAVIIGTPPNTHAALARQALLANKSVIVEKPFCLTAAEADALIALAEERDLTLTCYQNRRWDPDFLAIQRIVAEGRIGQVFHVELFIGGYGHPCDYWHSHEPVSGGVFYDWGSHYLDWALTLLPEPVADVRASGHKLVWRDVTNADQANLHVRFRGGCELTFIHSDVAAALKPKWYILGTRGAIVGDWRHTAVTSRKWNGDLVEERLAPAEAPPILTVYTRSADGLIHEERVTLPPAPPRPFHRNFADHLLAGEPLAIDPRASRRNIAVMEAAAHSAAHASIVVPLDDGAA